VHPPLDQQLAHAGVDDGVPDAILSPGLEQLVGVPVISVSVGPDRDAIIELDGFLK